MAKDEQKGNQEPVETLKSQGSVTPEQQSWRSFLSEQSQKEAERVEDAAKYLAGMIGIAFSIFLKTDAKVFQTAYEIGAIRVGAGLWLAALVISFFVFYPMKYPVATASVESIKKANRRAVQFKRACLKVSMGLFLLALGILSSVYFF